MPKVTFTKGEILTMRRALNALVTRHQLSMLSASDSFKKEIGETLLDLHNLDNKLLLLEPECSPAP